MRANRRTIEACRIKHFKTIDKQVDAGSRARRGDHADLLPLENILISVPWAGNAKRKDQLAGPHNRVVHSCDATEISAQDEHTLFIVMLNYS
jgi:hypothetical protein